ncbi:MAG: M20/M25/M40 family metallo-hydrolase, partial [Deltaproteobacteria bacterium]|nr:M20/M25/M40 family metallo-hydrolase [Deltaproteobacteria bacterium]
DEGELKAYLDEVDSAFKTVCGVRGAGLSIDYRLEYPAYAVKEDAPAIAVASRAMRVLGIEPRLTVSGGGSDGNRFNSRGITSVGVATGYDKVHTEREEQSISGLVKCGELVSAIILETAGGG